MQLELWQRADILSHDLGEEACTRAEPVTPCSSAPTGIAPLDGAELDMKVSEYVLGAQADRTRECYRTDWLSFERWCLAAGELALPASSRTLARYLAHLAELGRKPSTIRRARIAIGVAHGLAGAPRPDRDPRIRALERGIGRTRGAREQGSDPLVVERLVQAIATTGDTPRDCRDRALLLLGFAGAYRSSDLAALDVQHLQFDEQGLTVLLPRSKEDQLAHGSVTQIPRAADPALCAVAAVRDWIARVGRPQGPLFRVVLGAQIDPHRIHPRAVSRAVQRLTARAGLVGHFSSHSLRSGLATSAHARGATDREIQDHGRWRDPRSLDRYIHVRHVPGRRNVAASVL